MNRILAIVANTLFLLLIVGIILFFTRSIVTSAVLSSKLGIPVKVQQINVIPGRISVWDAKLKNSKGYSQPYALRIRSTLINAPLKNYMNKLIEIDSIEVSNILLTLELTKRNTSDNNWADIMKEIHEEEPTLKTHNKNRHAIIKKLVLTNLTVRIYKSPRSYQDKVIPRLEFQNVETKDGDLSRRIMQAIIYELVFNIRNILKLPIQVSKDAFNTVIDKVDSVNVPFFRRSGS